MKRTLRMSVLAAVMSGVWAYQAAPGMLGLGEAAREWLIYAGWLLSSLAATLGCLMVASRSSGPDRLAWRDFALGSGVWGVATLIWIAHTLATAIPPFPSLPDAAYLLSCLLFMAGMFRYGAGRQVSRIQLTNFALAVCSTTLVAFIFLSDELVASRAGALGTLVAFISPVLWFGTAAFGLIHLTLYAPRDKRLVSLLILGSVASQGVAYLLYGLSQMSLSYQVGLPFDFLWLVSFALMVFASTEEWARAKRPAARSDRTLAGRRFGEALIPSLAALLPLAAALISDVGEVHALSDILIPLSGLLAGLIGLREYWVLAFEREMRAKAERAASDLSHSQTQLSSVLESTTDSVVVIDRSWRITYLNNRARQALAGIRDIDVGESLLALFPEEIGGVFYNEYLRAMSQNVHVTCEGLLGATGRWLEVHAYPTEDGLSIFFRDISERRRAREELHHLAHHDPLTGLGNRLLFRQTLARMPGALGEGMRGAVLSMDLDNFKDVNDTMGHPAGDALLVQVADRLRESIREDDALARLGGDEFAVILKDVQEPDDAVALASRILSVLNASYLIDGRPVTPGVSIGIALAPDHGVDPDTLLKNADIALYVAKAEGKGAFRLFNPSMEQRLKARQDMKADLGRAIVNGELRLAYQPIIDLRANQPRGFEALLRWNHPARGLVPPDDFIPVAEETGLIIPMGEWALERACRDAQGWPQHLRVAVNLSPCQFHGQDLPSTVARILAETGLAPDRLELEITESVLLQDSDANLRTLHRLRELGLRTALDDFGTGYSSLGYLQKFPFDKIKIDRSFVSDLTERPEAKAIVGAVAGLGKTLGMAITAEGVETPQQLEKVRSKGCDEAQGYLFSRPVWSDEIADLLVRLHRSHPLWQVPGDQPPARDSLH